MGGKKLVLKQPIFQKIVDRFKRSVNSQLMRQEGVVINKKTKRDTFTFVYMKGDSLALSDREGRIQGFHRSLNAMKANAKAHAAAEKLNSKMKKEILK